MSMFINGGYINFFTSITNIMFLHIGVKISAFFLWSLSYLLNGNGTSGDSRSSDPEVDVVKEWA